MGRMSGVDGQGEQQPGKQADEFGDGFWILIFNLMTFLFLPRTGQPVGQVGPRADRLASACWVIAGARDIA